MDDVIEKMAAAAWAAEPGCSTPWSAQSLGVKSAYRHMMRSALRAVSETHRLVPIESTRKMAQSKRHGCMEVPPSSVWADMLDLAPDYTEATDG